MDSINLHDLSGSEVTQASSEFCFIAGRLHQLWWSHTTGRRWWESVRAFETEQEANDALHV
jgi:hypothetical protein